MMPNIGPLEIAIVLVIALIVFGPKKLPDLGRSLGKGIGEFRDGLSNIGQNDDDDDDDEDPAELTPPPAGAGTPVPIEEPEVTEVTGEVVKDKQD